MPFHLNDGGTERSHEQSKPADTKLLLKQALAERERLLKRCPRMTAYQQEIDRVLDKSGNHHGRLDVLETMIQGKLLELQKALYKATLLFGEAVR